MSELIKVTGVHKTYGGIKALEDVSLELNIGETLAVLGPNGAGKTSLLEILEGFRDFDKGSVTVLGKSPRELNSKDRQQLGIVLQESVPEPFLTVGELLSQHERFYDNKGRNVKDVAELCGVEDLLKRRICKLSGGQKRRVDLALAIMGDPRILFLDEPTVGFDPEIREATWKTIKQLIEEKRSIVLTTHYLEEAEVLAKNVILLLNGKVVKSGPIDELSLSKKPTVIKFELTTKVELPEFSEVPLVDGTRVEFATSNPVKLLNEITQWLLVEQVQVKNLEVTNESLLDVYLKLVKEKENELLA